MTVTSDTGWRLNSTQCIKEFVPRWGGAKDTRVLRSAWKPPDVVVVVVVVVVSWSFRRTWPPVGGGPGSRQPAWWRLWMEPGPASSGCSGEKKQTRSVQTHVALTHSRVRGQRWVFSFFFLQRHKREEWLFHYCHDHDDAEKAGSGSDWNARAEQRGGFWYPLSNRQYIFLQANINRCQNEWTHPHFRVHYLFIQ